MTLLTYYKVHYLRVYSWQQADKVMSTETGINILKTVDNTTDLAEIMLDKYLPPPEEEIHADTGNIISTLVDARNARFANNKLYINYIVSHILHIYILRDIFISTFFFVESDKQ